METPKSSTPVATRSSTVEQTKSSTSVAIEQTKRKFEEVNRSPSPQKRGRQKTVLIQESVPEELKKWLSPLSSTAANSIAFENDTQVNINDLSAISSDEYLSLNEGTDSDTEVLQATLIDANLFVNPEAEPNTEDSTQLSMETSNQSTIITNTDHQEAEDLLRVFRSQAFKKTLHEVIDATWEAAVIKGLEPINAKIDRVSNSVEAIKLDVEPLSAKVNNIAEKAETDHGTLGTTVIKTTALETKVDLLQDELDDMDQTRRLNNLIISRVKESPNENLCMKICQIAASADLNMSIWEIQDAFRVGKKSVTDNRPRLVLAKFSSHKSRMDLFAVRLSLTDPFNERVFVSEDLTIKRSKIYYQTRMLAKEKKYQSWTQNGRVLIRTTEGGLAHNIKKIADLEGYRNLPMGNFTSNN